MKSRKSLCKFSIDWLANEKYKLCLAKGKNDNCAKYILCSKEIDLSTIGANALDSHAKGKKRCDIAKNRSAGLCCLVVSDLRWEAKGSRLESGC